MTKKFILKDVVLDEVSFVDRPANPGAKVVFWKRDEAVVDPTRQNIANMTLHIDAPQFTKAVQDAIAAVKDSEAVEKVKEMVVAAVERSRVFLAKHGDHDQSTHGNWADGSGSGGASEGGKAVDSAKNLIDTMTSYRTRSFGSDFERKDALQSQGKRLRVTRGSFEAKMNAGQEQYAPAFKLIDDYMGKNRIKKDDSVAIEKLATDLATLHKSCCEVAQMSPPSVQPAVAVTFDELLERKDVQERAQEFSHMVYALQDSINSITNDPELRDDVRRDLLERSLNEFKAAVGENLSAQDQPEEDYMAKAAIQAAIAKSYLAIAKAGDWDESKHPREADGKFGGGGVSSGADSGKTIDYVRAAFALRSALKDFPPGNDPKLGVNRNEQARLKELLGRIGQRNARFSEEDKRMLRQVMARTKWSRAT